MTWQGTWPRPSLDMPEMEVQADSVSPLAPLLTDVIPNLSEVAVQVLQQGLNLLIHLTEGLIIFPVSTELGFNGAQRTREPLRCAAAHFGGCMGT